MVRRWRGAWAVDLRWSGSAGGVAAVHSCCEPFSNGQRRCTAMERMLRAKGGQSCCTCSEGREAAVSQAQRRAEQQRSRPAGQARPGRSPILFTHLLFVCFEYCGSTGTRAVRVSEEVCGMAGARRRDRMAAAVAAAWLGSGQGQNYPPPSSTQPQHEANVSLHWRVVGILLLVVAASVDAHNGFGPGRGPVVRSSAPQHTTAK